MKPHRLFFLSLFATVAWGCQPTTVSPTADFPFWDVGPPGETGSDDDDSHVDGVAAIWFGAGNLAPGENFDGTGGFSVTEWEDGGGTELCRIDGDWATTSVRFDCGGCEYALELEWLQPVVVTDDGSACLDYGIDPAAPPQEPFLLGIDGDIAWSHDGQGWVDDGRAVIEADTIYWEVPVDP